MDKVLIGRLIIIAAIITLICMYFREIIHGIAVFLHALIVVMQVGILGAICYGIFYILRDSTSEKKQ